ncbi:anthocyanin regulatory R-S protein isoform X2 [Lolium perenne]|uniref:anthocyanin regulatory R-S protein isoform X2 n=1 Tax=Lolium perenne TaxID=4522 RepID=UPI0021F65401|nr:anthocyanin regulatory R-S protein-like isoform X2 [Lolium perenne]
MALSSAPLSQEEPTPPSPGKRFSNQLAAAVRSINWTYAIFWSMSTSRPGFLTWKDGFYNGEIKTRKITNSTDLTDDQLVLERSQQLREVYKSLLSGEYDNRARRPTGSLSPEDLSDAEWYYTVCMTYAFRPGQGLPGKSFATNEPIWLCNAQFADTKIFQRALLAKTASIQTVACIPFMGGVLELGTADQVLEDTDMVNRIGTSFWELRFPTCSEVEELSSSPSEKETEEADIVFEDLDHNVAEATATISGEMGCLSDGNLERITKEIDELYGLCEELDVRALEDNWIMDGSFEVMSSPAPPVPDAGGITDDVATLSSSVESSRPSCFTAWKMSSDSPQDVAAGESQKLLKKAVAGGAWTNDDGDGTVRAQESNVKGHVMSERRRREKLNEMFVILKSLVPSIHKVDKASILAETIAYLKELEQRVEELESSGRPIKVTTGLRRHAVLGKKASASAGSKRKASELGDLPKEKEDGPSNVVNVTVMGKEVLLEVQCLWKELLMTRVFDALKALSLDVLSVQSSTPNGHLALKIRAQCAGSAAVAPGMISEALQKAIGRR